MKIARFGVVTMLMLVVGSAVGCADKQKPLIDDLTAKNNELTNKNAQLQDELTAAQLRDNASRASLQDKDAQLRALQAQLAAKGTVQEPAPQPTSAPVAEGAWEKGLTSDRVTVGADILFESGVAKLTAAGKSKLSELATELNGTYAELPLRVYGYTDNDPIVKTRNLWQDNLDLSANRAMEVTRFLQERGVAKDRFETVAMGDTHFVSPNTTKSGKMKNRRVEIVVIKVK